MSFYTENTRTHIRDDEKHTIYIHGDLPKEKVKLPRDIVIRLATGGYHKLEEWKRTTRFHSPHLYLANALMALNDSPEVEDNSVNISYEKLNITLRDEEKLMSEQEKKEVDRITKVGPETVVLDVAEDRFMTVDNRLKDWKGFDAYREMPLIREAFEGPDFPGHRIKELMDAMGGPFEFLKVLKQAHEELPKQDPVKYADLKQEYKSGISVAIRARDPEKCPALAKGIVITAMENQVVQHFPSEEDLAELMSSGRYANAGGLDAFEYPSGQKQSTAELRHDLKNPYYDREFFLAKAWKTFMDYFEVPGLAVPRELNPKVIVPNAPILTNRKTDRKKLPKSPVRPTMVTLPKRIKSLGDLESAAASTHGLLVQSPKPMRERKDMSPEQRALKRLAKKVELLLRFTDATTQKGLYNPHYAGEPILVQESLKPLIEPMVMDLHNRKAISAKPAHIFEWIRRVNAANLEQKLQWDRDTYIPHDEQPSLPDYTLCTKEDIADMMGVLTLDERYNFAMIGSASMGLPVAKITTHDVAYEAAKHGMTVFHGGGTRFHTIMGCMVSGCMHAYQDGYEDFNSVGIRVPIASRREGSLRHLFNEQVVQDLMLKFTAGNADSDYARFGKNFHFKTFNTLAQRQHPILGAGNSLVVEPGGFGTMYEMFTVALNNLYIKRDNLKGVQAEGIFPGFDVSIRPIFMDNAKINGGEERYYDFMRKMFTAEEREMMGVKMVYGGSDEIMSEIDSHKKSRFMPPDGPDIEYALKCG